MSYLSVPDIDRSQLSGWSDSAEKPAPPPPQQQGKKGKGEKLDGTPGTESRKGKGDRPESAAGAEGKKGKGEGAPKPAAEKGGEKAQGKKTAVAAVIKGAKAVCSRSPLFYFFESICCPCADGLVSCRDLTVQVALQVLHQARP